LKDYSFSKKDKMRIGGFQKQSLIDWSGKTVAVVFTKGCNFRCSYCHNKELVWPEAIKATKDIDAEAFFNYIDTRSKWLDGVVVTGGEPTIHKDLPAFICRIKKMGLKVKLDTNGSHPIVLKKLIDQELIDYVAMDIKTVFDLEPYQKICGVKNFMLVGLVKKSLKILRNSKIEYQLRATVLPDHHSQEKVEHLSSLFQNENYVFNEYREASVYSSV